MKKKPKLGELYILNVWKSKNMGVVTELICHENIVLLLDVINSKECLVFYNGKPTYVMTSHLIHLDTKPLS